MNKNEGDAKSVLSENAGSSKESNSTKSKAKTRGKKRKRISSNSSSESEDVLPDNTLEMEKCLHASAIKNNLDDTSVRKILKKVVTNDHVLAMVKLREEEEEGLTPEDRSLRPKLTRAKVKELMKVSPKAAAWNLEKMELTPIKHIPVKTRPEVKALIAQELPEDEDDEEYEPTNDDVPSDDDQGLDSCSDLDSQPRTPATPHSLHTASPMVVKDGPFKVPQDVSTPTRRKLDLEEEATIALRTRSKLSLSATSIEHIESTFIPPDDIPMPAVDDLWNQFLNECLNPASTSKNEDDDETDPEYNVAADPDAHDEDEEALGNGIIKISKKELNDLVTELFNIMPTAIVEDELITDNLANSVLTDQSQTEVSTHWEGKAEPVSDEENNKVEKLCDRITFEKQNYSRVSLGKSEPLEPNAEGEEDSRVSEARVDETPSVPKKSKQQDEGSNKSSLKTFSIATVTEEQTHNTLRQRVPPSLQPHLKSATEAECVVIQVEKGVTVLPEQIQILQQQLRQHIQLATSNYLQLFAHPIHYKLGPTYKEYLETFMKLISANPNSVTNVCNLKPAVELITTWENTVSADTPENTAMIQFIINETERCMRRGNNKNLYVGEFHETFKEIVANSPVFLYPYLLPSMPYRGDKPRRFCYLNSEDELIALGLEQFWQYVANNPSIYKPRNSPHPRHRWGLTVTVQLMVKYMFPWIPFKVMLSHIQTVRKVANKENPINKFFEKHEVLPVLHKLLPYNPQLTLYEQPENEVPRIWVRYLAKTSKRFKNYLYLRTKTTGVVPNGVAVQVGQAVSTPNKTPLSIDFTKEIVSHLKLVSTPPPKPQAADKFDIQLTNSQNTETPIPSLFQLVPTSTGGYLLPLTSSTMTVICNSTPIVTPAEIGSSPNVPETSQNIVQNESVNSDHCTCCVLLRKICKRRQTVITEFFSTNSAYKCGCRDRRYPKVSNRLRLLVNSYKNNYTCAQQALQWKIKLLAAKNKDLILNETYCDNNVDDLAYVTSFHLKILTRPALARNKLYTLLSRFNPYEHDPVNLATQMDQMFGNELVDLYRDFLGFLSPEQADKMEAFNNYFIRNCLTDLVKKIEEEVSDEVQRRKILEELHTVFKMNLETACQICTSILSSMKAYPKLAEHVFSLFPHRKEKRSEPKDVPPAKETPQPAEEVLDVTASCAESTVIAENTMDYEGDQSMSNEEENSNSRDAMSDSESCFRPIKNENTWSEHITPTSDTNVQLMVTVNKTEVQDYSSESSNSSMKIMFEEEHVKSEVPEWKRDEDKLILEVLKEHVSPEERQDKTILEIIEDKNIVDMISENLTEKSKDDIKSRLLYLLQLC